ncbi:MAG: FAD-dependent oxidoreductase [Gammaproteobacteria bacterium]|nr:MAG: FAD-dependent oxidoreductase [Gammaproteobacteria bacterium]
MGIPKHSKYLIIGAGIHGLSTAYHLALQLKANGQGSGKDILVVDKSGIAAGATGIACGVIRNNYFQPAMRELMAHSVNVWDSDPETYSYHPVGYMQISPEVMHENVASIAKQQKEIGYESVFIEGESDSMKYMQGLFHDWQAKEITSVLHEKRGGYANNVKSMQGLASKVEAQGVQIISDVTVTGFQYANESDSIKAVETNQGTIECDYVVIGAGPWVKTFWDMLELPKTVSIKQPDGKIVNDVPMWIYWSLQEGTLGVDPDIQKTNDGGFPPVVHVDSVAPLYSDKTGDLITNKMWGIYYKPDFNFGGIQGGAAPFRVNEDPNKVDIDPYGSESPHYIVDDDFVEMWVSALAHCQKRFEGTLPQYKREPSGGLGCFTPDSFPVFDVFKDNCYIIADSNHGYKMLGIGQLVAEEICGTTSSLLEPFRFARYAQGKLHPVSNSPYPWS